MSIDLELRRATEHDLRRRICDVGRALYDRGHIAPTDGNWSCRLDEHDLLCTPSQVHKGRLVPDQVVLVGLADGRPRGAGRASTELALHLALYRARPEVRAIVHAHSPCAVALSVAGVSLERAVVPEAVLALGGIPTIPYASPTTTDVPEAVLARARGALAFILERHGPVCVGGSLEEAFQRLEIVEHTARITLLALAAGGAEPLPDAERNKLRDMAIAAGFLPASMRTTS